MKKMFVLIILLSLLIPFGVYANERPPEPLCPVGEIIIAPAEWVEEVPAVEHEEHQHWIATTYKCPSGYTKHGQTCRKWVPTTYKAPHWEHRHRYLLFGWGSWHDGGCHGWRRCQRRWRTNEVDVWKHWVYVDRVVDVPGHFGEWEIGGCHGPRDCEQRTVVDEDATPGYWIDPVCHAPILGCTDRVALNFVLGAEVDDGSCTYPEPLFPMQLLEIYDPPEGWLPFCMVMTEGGVAKHRQPAICGAGIVEWIADNHPCGGMVYDDGTEYGQWACDRYGYYRQPISVLKCLWQRHLDGKRDIMSFRECHGR